MKNKLRILLTGASGSVGLRVLRQLSQQRHNFEITVFDIKSKRSRKIFSSFKGQIEVIYGDISNYNDI